MKNGKLRKIQIVLVAILYALACIAGYHCNQARREPITRKAVALFDGLLMLGALIAAFYIRRESRKGCVGCRRESRKDCGGCRRESRKEAVENRREIRSDCSREEQGVQTRQSLYAL